MKDGIRNFLGSKTFSQTTQKRSSGEKKLTYARELPIERKKSHLKGRRLGQPNTENAASVAGLKGRERDKLRKKKQLGGGNIEIDQNPKWKSPRERRVSRSAANVKSL